MDRTLTRALFLSSQSARVKALASKVTGLLGWSRVSNFVAGTAVYGVGDVWRKQHERTQFKQEMIRSMKEAGLDVLLCPAGAFPAVPHGQGQDSISCLHPTYIWNLLDFPAGTPQVTAKSRIHNHSANQYNSSQPFILPTN